MFYSLKAKLSFSYIMVALLCVSLVSIISNVFLEKQFRDYVIRNQERKNKEIVMMLGQQYREGKGWDDSIIENIGMNALEQGLILKVKNASGEVVWDALVHNNGMCKQMIAHMAQNMASRYPNWKGGYEESIYPISHELSELGTVQIGYYGPFYFNDNDLVFINTLNRLLIGVGVFSLIFALVLGTLMARRLSTPITKVISTAELISRGYFSDRITGGSNTKEIHQLTNTINNLADTLENQEKLRKRLTADVAHELRTPLATLQSHMEAMIDGIWKPDTQRLKSCHDEILRINRMIGDLEKLTRYESENLFISKTRFDIYSLVQSIIHNYESDYTAKGVNLEVGGQAGTFATADRDKISQVILNLLSNALKYTPPGGMVKVLVEGNDNETILRVIDNGIGIEQQDLPLIFERFYRADMSRNRLTGGAGIGLSITKAIVEAHKGIVTVRSKPNEGSEFIVRLPGN